jgi:hypothetical protein
MKVFWGTPPGCNCHPELYRSAFTWALYRNDKFVASGPRFDTYDAAYQAGVEFCETLPGQASQENQPNIEQN